MPQRGSETVDGGSSTINDDKNRANKFYPIDLKSFRVIAWDDTERAEEDDPRDSMFIDYSRSNEIIQRVEKYRSNGYLFRKNVSVCIYTVVYTVNP